MGKMKTLAEIKEAGRKTKESEQKKIKQAKKDLASETILRELEPAVNVLTKAITIPDQVIDIVMKEDIGVQDRVEMLVNLYNDQRENVLRARDVIASYGYDNVPPHILEMGIKAARCVKQLYQLISDEQD